VHNTHHTFLKMKINISFFLKWRRDPVWSFSDICTTMMMMVMILRAVTTMQRLELYIGGLHVIGSGMRCCYQILISIDICSDHC
jgi:hypothetical protein